MVHAADVAGVGASRRDAGEADAVSRTALTCPSCGAILGYRRKGGAVVPEPPLLVQRLNGTGTVMVWCDRDGCKGFLMLNGGIVAITPARSARLSAK
jgi:hypothetical protein